MSTAIYIRYKVLFFKDPFGVFILHCYFVGFFLIPPLHDVEQSLQTKFTRIYSQFHLKLETLF